MAVVVSLSEWRSDQPIPTDKNWMRDKLEKPFYDAELHRVEMSRTDHPGESNESVIDVLFIGATLLMGVTAYWFVKYIIY